MGWENLVQWTRSKLSQFTGGDIPVTSATSLDALTSSGRVAPPLFDLFENQSEFRLVVDVPAFAAAEAFTLEAGDGASGRRTREALTRSGGVGLPAQGKRGRRTPTSLRWPGGGPMTPRGDALVPAPAS